MKAVLASITLTIFTVIFGNSVFQIFSKENNSKQKKEFHSCLAVLSFLVMLFLIKLPGVWVV